MKKPDRAAAINLGMQTVTMAVFQPSAGGGITLTGFAQSDLIPDPAADGSRFGQLKVVLGEMKSQLAWKGGACGCAIPSQGVFTRFVQIPKVEPDKIDQVLFFEAQQNVPYPIEEVAWTYQVLPDKGDDKINALLVATKTDALESTVEVLAASKLTPQIVETSPTALYNAFRYNYPDVQGCSLLIDIGARATNLIFVEGQDVFIRTLPVGGNSITAALHKKFEPRSFGDVEEFKRVEGLIPPPGNYSGAKNEDVAEMGKIARTVMTRIHNEITRSVTFYRTTQKGAAPMRVFLAGGGASMPYTLEFFNEKLSLPIEFFNPLRRISVGAGVDQSSVAGVAHRLGECVGVALRELGTECPLGVSLQAASLLRSEEATKHRPFLVAAAAGLVASVALLGLYYQSATSTLARLNEQVQSSIAPLQQTADRMAGFTKQRDQLLEDGADLVALPILRTGWAEIINALNQSQPEKFLWITKLSPHPDVAGFAEGGTDKPGGNEQDNASGESGKEQKPAVTALRVEGLYLENEAGPAVVDEFVKKLSESPLFSITDENKEAVVDLRAAQSGDEWAYEYRLIVPLKTPIPL
jgi:type IV pilus assembly protein PilM